jgi:hypothetical protein
MVFTFSTSGQGLSQARLFYSDREMMVQIPVNVEHWDLLERISAGTTTQG